MFFVFFSDSVLGPPFFMCFVETIIFGSPTNDLDGGQEGGKKHRDRYLLPAGAPRLPKGGPGRPKGGPGRPAELQKATKMSQNEAQNREKVSKNGERSALYLSLFGNRFCRQSTK